MNKVLANVALAEAGAGVVLLAYPPLVVRLLFGLEIEGAGIIMSRIAGIALIGLGVSCWPAEGARQALYGMLTYSTLAMLYMAVIGIGGYAGILLWPAVLFHAVLTVLLGAAWLKQRTGSAT
jgi:hypothetical protein